MVKLYIYVYNMATDGCTAKMYPKLASVLPGPRPTAGCGIGRCTPFSKPRNPPAAHGQCGTRAPAKPYLAADPSDVFQERSLLTVPGTEPSSSSNDMT